MSETHELPDSWAECVLGDVIDYGSTEKAEPSEIPEEAWVLELEDVESNTSRVLQRLTFAARQSKSTKNRFRRGDVLYGKLRPYLNKVVRADGPGFCTTEILPLAAPDGLDAGYLFHWLRHPRFLSYVSGVSHGLNMPRLGTEAGQQAPFVLAPADEQKRIVAKVEELTARSRRAKEALDAVLPLLDRLRQSILAAAFRGDLTAPWRASHPGESSAEAVQRRRSKRESLRAANATTTGAGDPELPELPVGWTWARLGELGRDPLAAVQTGPFGAQLHNDEFVAEGVPVIAVGNLTRTGFTREGLYFVTPQKARLLARYDVQAGDVLFARSGATLGKVCVAPEFVTDWRMTGHILRLRLDDSVLLPDVAVFALRGAEPVTRQVQAGIRGMTRPGYNTDLLERIWVPVPPRDEQREMVRQILGAFRKIDRLSAAARRSTADLARCDRSILAKAFRGELVPQDPRDEPASVLLERIRTASGSNRGVARRRPNAPAVVEEPDAGDQHLKKNAPEPALGSRPGRRAPQVVGDLDDNQLLRGVFAALWPRGPLEKDDAVRCVAEHLRDAGYVEFQRLHADGPVYSQCLELIESAVKAGRLDRPKRGQVRACKADATMYAADDWRFALVASLGTEPMDREDAIRIAAEWARDNLGLEFTRLRSDGHIALGLRAAINSAIRRGEVTRHDATRISRAVEKRATSSMPATEQ